MTKMVQLSNEAYARLKSEKRNGESFSAVVLRLTRKKKPLHEALRPRPKKEIEAHLRMLREIDELDRKDVERWARTWGRRAR